VRLIYTYIKRHMLRLDEEELSNGEPYPGCDANNTESG
jgi:hypothetical protein